jgi:hypothetical protein
MISQGCKLLPNDFKMLLLLSKSAFEGQAFLLVLSLTMDSPQFWMKTALEQV